MELCQAQVKENYETLAPQPWVARIFAEVSLFRVLLYTEILFASLVLHPLNWQNAGLRLDLVFSLRSWIQSRTLGVQAPAYHPVTPDPATPSIQWLLSTLSWRRSEVVSEVFPAITGAQLPRKCWFPSHSPCAAAFSWECMSSSRLCFPMPRTLITLVLTN